MKQRIEKLITDRILVGDFEPGQLLKEEALAAEFSVSRTPIREILSSLVAKGYAEYEKQRGVTAPKIGLDTVAELLEAMERMIPLNVFLGAERVDAAQQERLVDLLLNLQEASKSADISIFAIAYWAWVREVIDCARNDYLCKADRRITFHVHRIRAIAMKGWSEEQVRKSMSSTVKYASYLLSAFAAHDGEKSQRLVVEAIHRLRREIAATQLGVRWGEMNEDRSIGVVA